jgi:hypothetical protein
MAKAPAAKKKAASKAKKASKSAPKGVKKVVKKAAKKTVPQAAASSTGLSSVRVRMFRQGLGDSFLITFDVGGDERHILIDCGTLGATTSGV